MSQSINRRSRKEEESIFGPPLAYYKDQKHSPSMKLSIAGILIALICGVDFLLATNILIYVRTMNPDSTKDIFVHSAKVVLCMLMIWISYRAMVWYVDKFQIKDSLKQNKLYNRIATDVIELESLLTNTDTGARRVD